MTMYTYYVDIMTGPDSGKVVEFYAETPADALAIIDEYIGEFEYVYQICVDVEDSELPQPIWDHLNGFYV